MSAVLAFDFGASSGRAIKTFFSKGALRCEEVHRFANVPVEKDGTLHWDFEKLVEEIHAGIEKAGAFDSLAFDTWGVDFGLLGKDGALIDLPVHYRDKRTSGILEKAASVMPLEELYRETGNQILELNTLFQLFSICRMPLFQKAARLLFMPDLFAHALGAQSACEYTIASTSQMFNISKRAWSAATLDAFAIPHALFAPFVESGTAIGTHNGAKIVAAAHDTQCAIAAMPCTQDAEHAAFLSCGTWSLLGMELDAPVLSAESFHAGLSNELGANGKINYLKNIIGLWLIQECRRAWAQQGHAHSFDELENLANHSMPLRCFIDVDDAQFVSPGDIPEKIINYCKKTNQHVPQSVGEIMRCIYESLALKYRVAVKQLENLTGKKIAVIHMLGGGARDVTLCKFTADCCNVPVVAGPIEAAALGNSIIQLVALGEIAAIDEGRRIIAGTEMIKRFSPVHSEAWENAWELYCSLLCK